MPDDSESYYPSQGGDSAPDDRGESEEMPQESTLVPRSMFPHEPKPGDTCTFKVVRTHEDEVELQYSEARDSGQGGTSEPKSHLEAFDSKMGQDN